MSDELTPREIKEIRGKYGLSQQAFARLLGIGEASIVRYEKGQKPSRANANLIRAANHPEVMRDFLEQDGQLIPSAQREATQKVVYAEIYFDEKGTPMDINEIYEITLQQEVLNEQAAEMLGDLYRKQCEAKQNGNEELAWLYDDIATQISLLKVEILDAETATEMAEMRGRILSLFDWAAHLGIKAA